MPECCKTSRRVKIIQHGTELETCCPICKPEKFERWQDPSNTHGGFRWQYEPQKYIKREQPDGSIFYEAKDERNADLEAQLMAPNASEEEKKREALAKKRANRRTAPLTQAEQDILLNRARRMIEPENKSSLILCP